MFVREENHSHGNSLLQVLFSRNTAVLEMEIVIYVGVAGAD